MHISLPMFASVLTDAFHYGRRGSTISGRNTVDCSAYLVDEGQNSFGL